MNWSIVAIIALLVAVPILWMLFSRHGGRIAKMVYQKRTALFSPDDRVFLRSLRQAVGDDYEIFGKIRVADVIVPKAPGARSDGKTAFNPIAGRRFDFVLCDKSNLSVCCAIQLHDKTNPARQSELQDDALKPICDHVGLPLVRFHIKADYAVAELRERLTAAMAREPFYLVETDGRKEPRISSLEDVKF